MITKCKFSLVALAGLLAAAAVSAPCNAAQAAPVKQAAVRGVGFHPPSTSVLRLTQGGPPADRGIPAPVKPDYRDDSAGFEDDFEGQRPFEDKLREKFKDLPPEEQDAKIREFRERRQAIKEELMSLPPEEREARMQELREQFRSEHALTHEERMQHFRERWENASDEEKARFCENAAAKCAAGGQQACDIAQTVCGS